MQSSTKTPTAGERAGPAPWALVSVLAANMLVDALEVSANLVALPAVGAGLGLSVPQLQWIVSGFAAGFGGLLLLGGRLVEHLGRRRVYLAALLVFAAASLAGALTDSAALLTVTRVVKGFCVALTAPTGLAIITSAVPEGPARRRAVSSTPSSAPPASVPGSCWPGCSPRPAGAGPSPSRRPSPCSCWPPGRGWSRATRPAPGSRAAPGGTRRRAASA